MTQVEGKNPKKGIQRLSTAFLQDIFLDKQMLCPASLSSCPKTFYST